MNYGDNQTSASQRNYAAADGGETSITVAIDDFMRSPKNSAITAANKHPSSSTTPAMMNMSNKSASAPAAQSFKKSGVCVSKSYQMLCGRCGRRFTSKLTPG